MRDILLPRGMYLESRDLLRQMSFLLRYANGETNKQTNKQTNRHTHRHAGHNTSHSYRGWNNKVTMIAYKTKPTVSQT